MINAINKLLEPVKRRLYLILGRALLVSINNSGDFGFYAAGSRKNHQRAQITALSGETLTDIERFQPYGFESYPLPATAEILLACPNGTRDNAVILVVADKEYRPTDLSEGDVCLYGKMDKDTQQHRIVFKANGQTEINGGSDFAVAYNDLKTAFDQLKNEVDSIFTAFSSWVTVPNDGGAALKAIAPTGPSTADMSGSKVSTVNLP